MFVELLRQSLPGQHCRSSESPETADSECQTSSLVFGDLGFRALGLSVRALGLRALGFSVWALGFLALGFRALGFSVRALRLRALGFSVCA